MTDHESRLRAALEAGPTPGEWEAERVYLTIEDPTMRITARGGELYVAEAAYSHTRAPDSIHVTDADEMRANAQLIAAANPEAIRSLLDRNDRLEAENVALRKEVDALRARQTESLDPAGVERLARGIGMVIGEDGPDEQFEMSFRRYELMLFADALRATTSRGDSAKRLSDAPAELGVERCGGGWQPIETAPKDGTTILLAGPEGVTAGGWTTDLDHGAEWEGQLGMAGFWCIDGGNVPPTHWMPLPDAPVTQGHSHGSEQDGPNSGSSEK